MLEMRKQSLLAELAEDTEQFRFIEDKAERIQDLVNKRLTKSLLYQCQDFKKLVTLAWIDIITDSGLLSNILVESFENSVTKQSSSKMTVIQKIMLFQIYTNLVSQQHPAANKLIKIWPTNLEKYMSISARFSDCMKLDHMINCGQKKGAFSVSITPGYFIQNIYFNRKFPNTEHPIFLQKIYPKSVQKSEQVVSFINMLLVYRHLKNTDGLIFNYENFDDSTAELIAKEIRSTFD